MQDKEIIDLYLSRDERAIRETEQRFGASCQRMAMHILGNRSDAEECVNDTWLKTWNSIPPANPDSLGAYVVRIVRNLAISRYRAEHAEKRNRSFDVQLDELAECIPAEAEESGQLTELMNGFLAELKAEERCLFVGRYWHNYTPEELATQYGLTCNAVNLRVKRIRDKLRIYLEERGYRI